MQAIEAHTSTATIDDVSPVLGGDTKQCPICEYPEPFSGETCHICGNRYCDECVTTDDTTGEWVCKGCEQAVTEALEDLAAERAGRAADEAYALLRDRQMGVL